MHINTRRHIHGVEPVFAACHHVNDSAHVLAHGLYQRNKLTLRVADHDVVLGVEQKQARRLATNKAKWEAEHGKNSDSPAADDQP